MDNRKRYQYLTYRAPDFVLDPSFQRWAQGAPSAFWEDFQRLYPEKRRAIREAHTLIQQFSPEEAPLSQAYLEEQLLATYDQIRRRSHQPSVTRPFHRTVLFRYAAAVALLLLSGALLYYYLVPRPLTYQTAYQTTRTILLADSTRVVLDANSRLRVAPRLADAPVREVWLEGEAFFHVRSSVSSSGIAQRFIVHTPRLNVEVLGTTFNVKNRSGTTEVHLEDGAVQVTQPTTQQRVDMIPGERVEIAANNSIQKKPPAPGALAWRDNTFDFRETTLEVVAQEIYDYYGKTVRFDDPSLVGKRFTARVSREDLDLLLSLIESAFSVRITIDSDTITVAPP